MIAHRLSTVLRSNRILVLDEGAIVDPESRIELLERCEARQRPYERRFEDALATMAGSIP